MRVMQVDVHAVAVKAFRAFDVAFGRIGEGNRIFVRLTADNGLVGWGESGHMLPGYSGERWDSAMTHAEHLAPIVLGRDPYDMGLIHRDMDLALAQNMQLKAAFDIALYDLMAQHSRVPLHKLFGGASVEWIPTQLNVSIGPIDQVRADVQRALEMGIKSIGVKAGKPTSPGVEHDVESVRVLREVVGPDMEIWVDFNGGYTRQEAIRAIRAMERFQIGQAEQPVPGWDLEGMARVAAEVETPIVADESLWSSNDVYMIAKLGAADVLHSKLPKPGGLYGSHKLAAVAEAVGLPLTMASLSMTNFGQAVLVHFLASHPVCHTYVSKLRAGKMMYPDDVVANFMDFHDGAFRVPQAVGVGIEIDEEKLKTMLYSSKHFEAEVAATTAQ
jgi:L-alanine-DL-glutamate epimerase-like enolase superfamily enzyme